MNISNSIKVMGVLDIFYILWVLYLDLMDSKVPFYDRIIEDLNAAASFENISVLALTIFAFVLNISIVVSGILMLKGNRLGVYISLVQAPFRCLLVIPPTLFFIPSLGKVFFITGWSLLMVIIITELIKIIIQAKWLKQEKETRGRVGEKGVGKKGS